MLRRYVWIGLLSAVSLALSMGPDLVPTEAAIDSGIAPQAGRRSQPRPRPKSETSKEAGEGETPAQSGKKTDEPRKTVDEQGRPQGAAEQEVITLGAELVSVPVVVFDKKKGYLFTELKKEQFTVYEDNVKQEIITFATAEAPITLVVLVEFSNVLHNYDVREKVILPVGMIGNRFMKTGDYVAVVAFDMRPKVLNDFTSNTSEVLSSFNLLIRNFPAFREANLFDALRFVLDGGPLDGETYKGLAEVSGRTAVLLVGTGFDTFSKINFDEARKVVANSGVPIYSIGVAEMTYIMLEPYLSGPARLDFLQAQNTLRTFSESTGGRYYNIRFVGELPSVMESIMAMLRNQYVLGYTPGNLRREGKKRKIKVLVDVDGDGQEDNKKLEVQYRDHYIEPKELKK